MVAGSDPDHGRWLPLVDDPLARAARAAGAGLLVRDPQGLQVAQPIDFGAGQTGVVRLGLSSAGLERDLDALGRRNLVAGLAFLGVSLLLSLALVGRITRPLAELTASAEAVAQGQFDRRIAIRTNDELELLGGAFNRMLARLDATDAQVRRLAFFDSVTELPNRLQFRQLLGQVLADARRYGTRGAVLFLDLDHFKLINDNFGHDAGDRLLQAFAQRLTTCLRGADLVAREGGDGPEPAVARLGGDEFTIMLGKLRRPEDPARVAERVLAALGHPFDLGEQTVVVGTSIGIALFPDDGSDPETLLKHADLAMYHAKRQGRSNFQFYSSGLGAAAVERLALERELRTALARNELELHYQPQLQPASGAVIGLEALLRWRHSRLGVLPPGRILGLAEETGLILPIGTWVLRQACAAAKAWSDAGCGPLRIGVNLSAAQLLRADFVGRLGGLLEASGLAPDRLELEITETAVAADGDQVAARRAELKELGVRLAIDDFGAGHAGLRELRRLRPDQLKIDRSFVREIGADADAAAIVDAIVTLAQQPEPRGRRGRRRERAAGRLPAPRRLRPAPGFPVQPAAAGRRGRALAPAMAGPAGTESVSRDRPLIAARASRTSRRGRLRAPQCWAGPGRPAPPAPPSGSRRSAPRPRNRPRPPGPSRGRPDDRRPPGPRPGRARGPRRSPAPCPARA